MSEVAVNGDDVRVGNSSCAGSSPSSSSSCAGFNTTPSPSLLQLSNNEETTTTSLASSTRVETGQPDTPVRCFPDIEKMANSFALDDNDDDSCTEDTTEFPDDDEPQQPPEEETPESADAAAVSGPENEYSESSSAEISPAYDLNETDEQSETIVGSYYAGETLDVKEIANDQEGIAPTSSFDEPESTVVLDDLVTDRYEPSPEFLQLEEEAEDEKERTSVTELVERNTSFHQADEGEMLKKQEFEPLEPVTTEEDDSYSVADEESLNHAIPAEEEYEAISRSMQSYPTDEGMFNPDDENFPPSAEPIFAEEEYEKYVQSKREEDSLFVEIEPEPILEREVGPLRANEAIEPSAAKPAGTTHILILTSSMGMNNRNQHRAIQLLDALGFMYENLDGSDPANKEIRNELFRISGMHGVYPLFFLVREDDDALDLNHDDLVQFLGDWETVEGINDSSALPREILDANPGFLTWEKIPGLVRSSGKQH